MGGYMKYKDFNNNVFFLFGVVIYNWVFELKDVCVYFDFLLLVYCVEILFCYGIEFLLIMFGWLIWDLNIMIKYCGWIDFFLYNFD